MPALFDFLQKNQIEKGRLLPAVHSTEAYFIKKFIKTGRIEPQTCKFFDGEKLSYFFIGRPAFKRTYDTEPDYWELQSWSRLSEQNLRVDKWSVCRVRLPSGVAAC
jgi:hypothetical protein